MFYSITPSQRAELMSGKEVLSRICPVPVGLCCNWADCVQSESGRAMEFIVLQFNILFSRVKLFPMM